MLERTLGGLIEPDIKEVEFHYSYNEKLKKLSGFQSGRHFLPKYHSKSLEDFVSNISVREIEDQMVEITDKLRSSLKLGIQDFSYDVNSTDGGLFDCSLLTLQVKCIPDPENLNGVIHFTRLILKTLNVEYAQKIFASFSHQFSFARINLSSKFHLKDFIHQLEIFNEKEPEGCSYYYDPTIQFLEINFKSSAKKLILSEGHMDIYFSENFSIFDFIALCNIDKSQ